MSNKNTTSTAPNSSQPTMTEPKKDNTALIVVLVVVGLIIGLPIIGIIFLLSMAFRFADGVIDNIDFDDWEYSYSEEANGDQMEIGQRFSASNLWVLGTNPLITGASVSQKDCRNMSYVAELGNGKWFDPTFCSGASIQVGAETVEYDDGEFENWLYISDGVSCASYNIDLMEGILDSYRFVNHTCTNVEMKTFPLVDTGEADSPNSKDDSDMLDEDEGDDDEEVEDSSARQKSST